MAVVDAILGLLGVFGGIASTISDFSGARATLYDAMSAIIEFVSGFFA